MTDSPMLSKSTRNPSEILIPKMWKINLRPLAVISYVSSDWGNTSSQYIAKNIQRILSYLTTKDRMVLMVALICSMASGVVSWLCFGSSIAKNQKKVLIGPQPLPIMNIVFGELVGSFSDYFLPDSTTTESEFKASVSRLRSVQGHNCHHSIIRLTLKVSISSTSSSRSSSWHTFQWYARIPKVKLRHFPQS